MTESYVREAVDLRNIRRRERSYLASLSFSASLDSKEKVCETHLNNTLRLHEKSSWGWTFSGHLKSTGDPAAISLTLRPTQLH